MKRSSTFLLTIIIVCLLPLFSLGQVGSTNVDQDQLDQIPKRDLFAKGTSLLDLIPNISYESTKTDDSEPITSNTFNANLRYNYFFWNNVALLAGIHSYSNTWKSEFGNFVQSYNVFELGAQYARVVGGIPLMFEVSGGWGTYQDDDFGEDSKASTLALNMSLSAFIHFCNTGAYLRPLIGYGTLSRDFTGTEFEQDFKACINGLYFGAMLVQPIVCGDYYWGLGPRAQTGLYGRKSQLFQFVQYGVLGFGNSLVTFSNSDFKVESRIYALALTGAYYYYFLNNLAGGIGLDYTKLNIGEHDTDQKTSTSTYSFIPMVRGHLPVAGSLNHLFLDAGPIIGSSTTITTSTSGDETVTGNTNSGFEAGIGYNLPVSDNFLVTGIAQYRNTTSKNSITDAKTTTTGTRYMLGFTYKFH